jgi:hypothetical protein
MDKGVVQAVGNHIRTAPARDMAIEKFGNTLAFFDGVIEHLSDSTPV